VKRNSIRIAVMMAAGAISTIAAAPQTQPQTTQTAQATSTSPATQSSPRNASSAHSAPASAAHSAASGAAPAWLPWSDAVFTQAARDHRFVLLDLEAIWCHWCHVMDVTTYRDPKVLALLHKNYLTVRVDQDSRPDLSNRYEDYGWPATVVFDGAGHEIVKRQGYLTPEEMGSMLQAIIDDPSPGPSVQAEKEISFPTTDALPAALQAQLEKDYLAGFDSKQGSWGFDQKYLDVDSVELAIDRAARGDQRAAAMARQSLDAQLQILDPVWGGFYQYSTDGVWTKPHFEKIMSVQAENLRIYSEAYAQWNDPKYLHAAQAVQQFFSTFLTSPDGAFYTSQDADIVEGKHSAEYFALNDKDRRKQGVPRVDTHVYARENGWAITALAQLYEATGDTKTLDSAIRAANWITQNRALPSGGFRHGTKDVGGPFLGDSVAMARAYVALYRVTADRKWLTRAATTTAFIDKTFRANANSGSAAAGFVSTVAPTDKAYKPHPQRDENVAVARVANQLFYYTGDAKFEAIGKTAMRYLAAEPIATRLPVASVLVTEYELTRPPLHLTVVGAKSDPAAQSLYTAALKYPSFYKRVEWWDTKEGKLPNPDVQYPSVARAAAYICTQRTCSPPIFDALALPTKVNRVLGVQENKSDQASAKVPQ
jgi:uncharacterized protein YyaL (SSP411 family)